MKITFLIKRPKIIKHCIVITMLRIWKYSHFFSNSKGDFFAPHLVIYATYRQFSSLQRDKKVKKLNSPGQPLVYAVLMPSVALQKSLSWAGELCIENQESGSGGQQPWLDLAQPVVQGITQGANHSSCPENLFILQSHGPVAAFRPCPHSRWLRGEAGGTPPRSAAPAAAAVKRSDQRLSRRSQTPIGTCSWGRTTPAACGTLPAQGGECKGTGKATLSKDGCRASERAALRAARREAPPRSGAGLAPARQPGPAGQRSRGVRGVQGCGRRVRCWWAAGDATRAHRTGIRRRTPETQSGGSWVPHWRPSVWVRRCHTTVSGIHSE